MQYNVIVIGSGIAGLCAAIEAFHSGSSVLLIEKESTLGGNSVKATSGISASETCWQNAQGIKDSTTLLKKDVITSSKGHSNPKLVNILVRESKNVIPWLSQFGINLSCITQCGGHSAPRTHCESDGSINIGRRIVNALVSFINNKTSIDILIDRS